MKFWSSSMVMVLLAGCSGKPGMVRPPNVDASAAAAGALERYDRDRDGALREDELAACPSLLYAMHLYDTNADRALSREEIEGGIGRWSEAGVGARSLAFRVQLDGRALEGARIVAIPEAFLDGAVRPAAGVAGPGGNGYLGMAPEDRPANAPHMALVQPGLYRVEITHPSREIPARYNTSTSLGLEIARDSVSPEGVVWKLTTQQ